MGLLGRACMSPNMTTPNGYLGVQQGIRSTDGSFAPLASFGVSPASPAEPPSPPKGRPSPPTGPDCSCVGERHGLPVAHHGLCRLYSVEDDAWCRTKWVDVKTGKAPTYAEALATVQGGSAALAPYEAAEVPTGRAVPPESISITLPAQTTEDLLQRIGDGLRDVLAAQAEIEARHTGQRCGTCQHCLGHMADPRCRHERIVVERDAIRRIWCHVQAISTVGLHPISAAIWDLLRGEVAALAAEAGVK